MNTARTRTQLPFNWPQPPLNLVLHEPEIPPNTGNIARLCAATGTRLHLIEPLGFRLTDKAMRRAGLDYWDAVDSTRHAGLTEFMQTEKPRRFFLLSTAGTVRYTQVRFAPGDHLIFGSESRGLPQALLESYPQQVLNIPMQLEHVRSLNLANCAAIVLYEALRQLHAAGSPLMNDRAGG